MRLSAALAFALSLNASAQVLDFRQDIAGPRAVLETQARYNDAHAPIDIHFRMGGVELLRQEDGFHEVRVEGLVPLGQLGAPDVPTTGALFAVPPGMKAKLTVVSEQTKPVEFAPLRACQPDSRCQKDDPEPFVFDGAIYESAGIFPQNSIVLEELGQVQGMPLVRVAVYPVRMQMAKQGLLATTEIRAQLEFEGQARAVKLPSAMATLTSQIVANPSAVPVPHAASRERMLILSADSLRATLDPFIQWKTQRGIEVEVKTLSELGGTRDAALRFVKTYYNRTADRPSYLLLVGDKNSMPGFRENTSKGSAATDYTYTLLEGSDELPDMLHGRLLASTVSEAKTQVERWIEYEKNGGKDWPSHGTTIASSEGFSPSDEQYAQQVQTNLKAGSYNDFDTFLEARRNATPDNIRAALKEGRSWVSYFGHGSGTFWASTNGYFDLDEIRQTDNAGRLPFVLDVACDNGSWVDIGDCFGKAWLTSQMSSRPTGAVAYYGGSVSISWNEPAVMSVGTSKYHFEKPVHSVGASVFAGQMYLMEKMGVRPNTTDNWKWFNLFGDPSLMLRTDDARLYSVGHSVGLAGNEIEVFAYTRDAFGEPVQDAVVAVSARGKTAPLAVGKTDAHGEVTLALGGYSKLPPGTLLTSTGYNLETYEVILKN